jgi:hypothetical protein
MANLLPNLDTFLNELHAQSEMVESISESNGKIIIKLKYERFPVLEKAKLLHLDEYVTRVFTGPYPGKTTMYSSAQYNINRVAIAAGNLTANMKTFLSDVQKRPEVERISKSEKEIIIVVKEGVMSDPEKAGPFLRFLHSEEEKLNLKPYIKFVPTNPHESAITKYSRIEYQIDLEAIHANRLREFFHKDTTQKDACDSIYFLTTRGWSQEQFNDLGVSRATFFRYRSNNKEPDESQPVSQNI